MQLAHIADAGMPGKYPCSWLPSFGNLCTKFMGQHEHEPPPANLLFLDMFIYYQYIMPYTNGNV